VLQQHQGQQGARLVRLRHEPDQQPGEPDRLVGERAGASRVALGEHEVDHDEHAVDALGEVVGRYAVGDAGVRDLLLRPEQALSHRRLRGQERPPDRRRGEPGDDLERQGHPGLESECRVAAREDQPQPVVAHR
jgi:hypothetical protein